MEKIAIAISGGVDSLVAAYLLKRRGLPLIGINFINGFEDDPKVSSVEAKLHNISDRLKIPIKVVDIRKEFKTTIVDYFIKTYCEGKTPNPCLKCNHKIKFGLLMDIAKKMGADKIATGHYARIEVQTNGIFSLKKGIDKTKDQSYFLSRLRQNQLANSIFPLGNMTKAQVVAMAYENNLQPTENKESQDICFIKTKKYSDFINKLLKKIPKSGEIIDTNGKRLGTHNGLHHFTIGQRRGINCPSTKPYYVIKIYKAENRLVVGEKKLLYSSTCSLKNINWISSKCPKKTIRVNIKIRYRHPSSIGNLIPIDNNSAKIEFDVPQLAITPGQGAVFFIKNKVIGSGWVKSLY